MKFLPRDWKPQLLISVLGSVLAYGVVLVLTRVLGLGKLSLIALAQLVCMWLVAGAGIFWGKRSLRKQNDFADAIWEVKKEARKLKYRYARISNADLLYPLKGEYWYAPKDPTFAIAMEDWCKRFRKIVEFDFADYKFTGLNFDQVMTLLDVEERKRRGLPIE